MKIKVYPDSPLDGGVGSVVADHKALLFNHTFVEHERDADLIVVHANAKSQEDPDITYTHGLYPTQDPRWGESFHITNEHIFYNIANSLRVAAVSKWGGALIKRYTGVNPAIIHNGIFYKNYERGGHKNGVVLWGKTTINPVCDPADFILLSQKVKGDFASFTQLPGTVRKAEPLQRNELPRFLRTCSILVATTKENDSLLIMEAMASGVPVLAYDWGMAKDRLSHKQGCYLVRPGNMAELIGGYHYLKENWQLQSEIARTVAGWFDWELQRPKLEALLTQTLHEKEEPIKVSIVIPCHNYGLYVKEAIQSAKNQTVPCEVIVIDDGSSDNSLEIIKEQKPDVLIEHGEARGVASARNAGIAKATGNMIVCLDADDILEPDFAEIMLTGFSHRNIAIAFSPINIIDHVGKSLGQTMFNRNPVIPLHKRGHNQVPSCCMFKKTWWERADGYDCFLSFTEDANLWLKMFLLKGFAVKVTGKPVMHYRRHKENNSLKPPSPWNIFTDQDVINNDDLSLVLIDQDEEKLKSSYWRLKELPYALHFFNELTVKPKNYFLLEPSDDIKSIALEQLKTWTQLFLLPQK